MAEDTDEETDEAEETDAAAEELRTEGAMTAHEVRPDAIRMISTPRRSPTLIPLKLPNLTNGFYHPARTNQTRKRPRRPACRETALFLRWQSSTIITSAAGFLFSRNNSRKPAWAFVASSAIRRSSN